jgi:hypothetical protein
VAQGADVRCPWCAYEQRRPADIWLCPVGHENAAARRHCGRCRYDLPASLWDARQRRAAAAITWWAATCRRCGRWIWSERAPADVVAACRHAAEVSI